MAAESKLTNPRDGGGAPSWHETKWASLPASLLWTRERRMEAENYLSSGYGIRLAMHTRATGRSTLGTFAHVWQPSRLKGVIVGEEFGTPFLAATQVFDLRPIPRKYLALEKTSSAETRMASRGMILVTRSGSVGRSTLAHAPHEDKIISDDLLRVTPRVDETWGWIYAYLHSRQARAMMTAEKYGHMIKHLEVSHLESLPIPVLRDALLDEFRVRAQEILALRVAAHTAQASAERMYERLFTSYVAPTVPATGFELSASRIFASRRRLEASRYVPTVDHLLEVFKRDARCIDSLGDLSERVFVPGRFKHVYGEGGMPYLDSADILEVNPDVTKHVLSLTESEQLDYRVEPGWLLMPCSGQVYGNIGHTVIATESHVGKVLTNHVLRICPRSSVRSGYLQCALAHLRLGRPLIVRFAFGSSVPELSPQDLSTMAIPRFDPGAEAEIADLTEAAAEARDSADELEQALGHDAEGLIDQFLEGETTAFRL